MIHEPVLLEEVLLHLTLRPGMTAIDATADGGGHAVAMLGSISPGGTLLAIEWDENLIGPLRERVSAEAARLGSRVAVAHANYRAIRDATADAGIAEASAILFDFGASSYHLDGAGRGFSFRADEPLDMRYSPRAGGETAADILARRAPHELAAILREFGGERYAERIARAITAVRRRTPVRTAAELADIVRAAYPAARRKGRIDPATRTFQALRIAVNRECENMRAGLAAAVDTVAIRGRIAAITFHTGEERIVKDAFRSPVAMTRMRSAIRTPILPTRREIARNPRARSAKLRVYERIA